jgi:hypothetical protein
MQFGDGGMNDKRWKEEVKLKTEKHKYEEEK